jgi:MFS family permease
MGDSKNSGYTASGFVSQLGLLIALQALLLVNNVTLIAVNALAGFQLADNKLLATLPVTGYVLGGALWAMPAARFMKRYGRRSGYLFASVVGMVGAMLATLAMAQGSLALLCFATFVGGLYNAFGASLRFAAADLAEGLRPSFKAKAMSLVLTGGIFGGVLGPEVSKWSRTAMDTPFEGTYLTLMGFAAISFILAWFLKLPTVTIAAGDAPARPLGEILRQPACWVAIVAAAFGYGIMNLLMVATPLAMQVCNHSYAQTAFVLQWHIVGMFAPGLFTGSLISRFGAPRIIAAGCALMLGCVAIAESGLGVAHFTAALFLLGVGWNFLYTGGSTLLTSTYRPSEKNKVQGFMDACVFGVMVSSSASAGALVHVNGWSLLNLWSLPFVLMVLAAALWLQSILRSQRAALSV